MQRHIRILGWVATGLSILMYVSYLPQIVGNLHGTKSDYIQPLVAAINCSFWVVNSLFRKKKDWPVALANMPGIIFGLTAFFTVLY